MLQYVFNVDSDGDDPMMLCAEEQCWDEATLKQLRDEYNIIFMTSGDGVRPIMIKERNNSSPLFVIGSEDDGTIFFQRRYGQFCDCFSSYWVRSFIADLEEALRFCNSKM